jgi:hypothetical protein
VRRKVVVLESCDADNLIRNEIQFQLFHRYKFLIKRCAYHFIILDAGETEYYKLTMDSLNVESATKVSLSNT